MKKTFNLVHVKTALAVLALLATPAAAVTTSWTDNDFSGDHLWTTAGNWNLGTPTFGVNARIDSLAAAGNVKPTLDAAGAADRLDLGFDFDGELDVVSGGVLSLTNGADGDAVVGWNTGSAGTLNILGTGQVLANDDVRIGGHDNATDSTAVGIVNVSDSGVLSGLGGIEVGRFGNGTINVSGTANVTSGLDFFVGFQPSATGTLLMDGGTASSAATFRIGDNGTGTLNLNSGTVTAGSLFMVGNKNGSMGTVTMTGGMIDSGSDVQVGIQTGANGSMNISGGTIDAFGALRIGGQNSGDSGTGSVTISAGTINTGVGSVTPRSVEVGRFGNGELNISGTGAVQATSDVFIGFQGTATGTVTMDGGSLSSTATFRVGDSGTGTLNMNSGTINSGSDVVVGNKAGSMGTVAMTGGTIDAFGALRIGGRNSGDSGTGSVTISAGAINTGVGSVTPRSVEVGRFGNGSLNISGTGAVQATSDVFIGFQPTATGTVTMDGGTLSSTTTFRVGDSGTGTLNMNSGTVTSGSDLMVGNKNGSMGTVTMTGGMVDSGGDVQVGIQTGANGSMEISGGTIDASGALRIGGQNSGDSGIGSVTISAGSINVGVGNPTPRSVEIGRFGDGTLNVSGTASVQSTDQVLIGFQPSAIGTMTMDDGTVTSVSHFRVGDKGTGTLNMNGGSIDVGGQFIVGFSDAASGQVDLAGGVIEAADLLMNDMAVLSLIDFTGGTMILDSDQTASVNTWIGNGLITAFGGSGTVLVDFNITNVGQTTLFADNAIGVPGDYNNNGIVDAADYTLWLDNLGATTALPNDSIGGTIGQAQYDQWKSNFGNSGIGSALATAGQVPEPSTGLLLSLCAAVSCLRRHRRNLS